MESLPRFDMATSSAAEQEEEEENEKHICRRDLSLCSSVGNSNSITMTSNIHSNAMFSSSKKLFIVGYALTAKKSRSFIQPSLEARAGYAHTYAHTYTHTHIHAHSYVCMYVCMYVPETSFLCMLIFFVLWIDEGFVCLYFMVWWTKATVLIAFNDEKLLYQETHSVYLLIFLYVKKE